MRARQIAVALAAGALAASACAEPTKAPVRNAEADRVQAPVVVASAETVLTPAPVAEAQQSAAPAKRVRTARVSSCRCGGQTPSSN